MSKSTLTRRHFSNGLAGLALLGAAFHGVAQTQGGIAPTAAIPAELGAFGQAPAWQMQGSGALRFFGFKAYDANLWAVAPAKVNPLLDKNLFALEIVYNTSIKADEIVNVSLVEMARLRRLTDVQLKSWTADLQRTFPNVVSGDRLTGVFVPQVGTRFFLNSRLITEINDPAFGDAFFAIWLDEGTKRPDLRRALLALK